jgi:vitamin B12 transporter
MKHITVLLLLILLSFKGINAQTKISGRILDQKKQPVPGVNVLIKDSYDGASSDVNGNYSFTSTDTGEVTIAVSMIGFDPIEKKFRLNGTEIIFSPVLKEALNVLKVVTISAGTIEASDENRYNCRSTRRYSRCIENTSRGTASW